MPPVYSDHGINLRLGRNVFVNQGCRFNDIGGIEIGDDVMIGPDVSLITSGHPLDLAGRRSGITAAPIRIGRNVWIGASRVVLQGVTVGDDAVIGSRRGRHPRHSSRDARPRRTGEGGPKPQPERKLVTIWPLRLPVTPRVEFTG